MKQFIIFMKSLKKIKPKTALPGALILCVLFPLVAHAATYTVKAGDTLYDISASFGVSVENLQNANCIKGDLIFPGQKLIINPTDAYGKKESGVGEPDALKTPISDQGGKTTQQVPASHPDETVPPAQELICYTVKPGDCLYKIAVLYRVSVESIMQANNVSSIIYPGQKLLIPAASNITPIPPGRNDLSSRSTFAQPARNVLDLAVSLLGSRYVYGGSGPSAFDCSGFVSYVFRSIGIKLPHSAAEQSKLGIQVENSSLQPGDLVFFSYYSSGGINHVGIYAGDNRFIHASSSGGVKYSSLSEAYYEKNYRGARRLLAE